MWTDDRGALHKRTPRSQSLSSAANPLLSLPCPPLPRPDEVIWPCKALPGREIMNELTKHVCCSAPLTYGGQQGWPAAGVHGGRGFTHVAGSLQRFDGLCALFREILPLMHCKGAQRKQHLLMSHTRLHLIEVWTPLMSWWQTGKWKWVLTPWSRAVDVLPALFWHLQIHLFFTVFMSAGFFLNVFQLFSSVTFKCAKLERRFEYVFPFLFL